MAEESTINQLKSEDAEEKTNPIGRLTITQVPPRIHSRYLSGPKGSCHDLCKYGIHDAIEAKPWSPAKKKVTKKERKTKVPEENVTSLAGTKKSGSSSKPSQATKHEKPNIPIEIKEVTYETKFTSEKNTPPSEENDVSLEHNNSDLKQTHSESSPLPVKECSKSQTKGEIVTNKTASTSSSRKETENRSKQKCASLTSVKEKSTPLSLKRNVKKPSSLRSKSAKNFTKAPSQKIQENVEELKPELASSDNLQDKVWHVTEPASSYSSKKPTLDCDETKLSSPSPSPSECKSLKQISMKTGKSGVSPSRKGLRTVAANKGKTNTLHKSRSASRTPSVLSSVSSSNISLRKHNGDISKANKTGHCRQGENVKFGYKIRPKMSTVVGGTNMVITARKLTFRRGKVIELQPQSNNNIPRRLKFKPARIMGDDTRGDINRGRKSTSLDNKVDGGGDENAENTKPEKVGAKLQMVEGNKGIIAARKVCGDGIKIGGSRSGSGKVVLRHQNVEGKKNNPRLYNNVIEETASMLAELRKSKVKALVGAFETVISLDSPREAASTEVSTTC